MPRTPRKATAGLSHVDAHGAIRMVDVSEKPVSARVAIARGRIHMSAQALRLVRAGAVKKGDPLQSARLAGIMAAKRTEVLSVRPTMKEFAKATTSELSPVYMAAEMATPNAAPRDEAIL